jgi:hypothetical protein
VHGCVWHVQLVIMAQKAVSFEADHIVKVVIVSANAVEPGGNTHRHGVIRGRV